MKKTSVIAAFALLLNITGSTAALAQHNDETDHDHPHTPHKSKLLTGLYVGSYFANKYSASTYNGYGFDVEGNRYTFINSFMYQKLKNEYGGGYGQRDLVADAIGVDQFQWEFNESDMPFNMRYTPAILVGANFKIPLTARNSLLVNVNGTKISVEGNFTLSTIRPANINPALNSNIQTHVIRGGEQRLLIQVGYQQIFGEDEKFNFFLEGGIMGTLAKFDRNVVYINNLQIDLAYYVNQTLNPAPGPTRPPVGFALGAFAGAGANIDVNQKINVQLVYTPSYEKINIGTNRRHKLQNGIGLRFYYKL